MTDTILSAFRNSPEPTVSLDELKEAEGNRKIHWDVWYPSLQSKAKDRWICEGYLLKIVVGPVNTVLIFEGPVGGVDVKNLGRIRRGK